MKKILSCLGLTSIFRMIRPMTDDAAVTLFCKRIVAEIAVCRMVFKAADVNVG